jgi:hypothetical protein
VTDTLFADVSESQVPVDDSYPYQVLATRVCDATHQDHNFAANYAWMRCALDSGRMTFGIVYTYVRPKWSGDANIVRSMIDAGGGLRPQVALMLDVESGGDPPGDGSSWINVRATRWSTPLATPRRPIHNVRRVIRLLHRLWNFRRCGARPTELSRLTRSACTPLCGHVKGRRDRVLGAVRNSLPSPKVS